MNLANKITLLRVILIPIFLFVYLVQPLPEIPNLWLAIFIFTVAAITDAIDGYVARKYQLVSNFGKLMDPLADKLLVCSALVAYLATGSLSGQFAIWAVIIMISREFYVSGLRMLALEQNKVLAASRGGKTKTGLQIALIIVVLLPIQMLSFDWLFTLHNWIVLVLLAITTIVSVWSVVDYTLRNKDIFTKNTGG